MKRIRNIIILSMALMMTVIGCSVSTGERKPLQTEVAPVKYNRKSIVTIIADDGCYDTGVVLNDLAQKHGLHLTIAGIVDYIEPYLAEWKKIEKENNLELISHSYSHVKMSEDANVSRDEIEHQIGDSIKFYSEHFMTDQIAFIPPENAMCEAAYEVALENGIYAIRQGGRELNYIFPEEGTEWLQWYNLATYGIADVATTEERNGFVDRAMAEHTWLIEMWHDVSENADGGRYQEISTGEADEHMSYIASKAAEGEIWAASLVDVTKYAYESKYASAEAYYDEKKITVKLQYDESLLPKDIFDAPLTVRILLPEEVIDAQSIVQKNSKLDLIAVEEEGKVYLQFEMRPNSKAVKIKLK